MPFTIGGEWIPDAPASHPTRPVKVIKEKRRSTYVTIILHLSSDNAQLKRICSDLKKQLGCGGSVKDNTIELQGDQIDAVNGYLKKMQRP